MRSRIEITIGKEFKKYFINRYWHSTQQLSDLQNGDMKLTMIAPISPDLIAWIMSWGEGIKSAKPSELKSKLMAKHKASLKNLQE